MHTVYTGIYFAIYLLLLGFFLWCLWKWTWPLARAIVILVGGLSYALVSGVIFFFIAFFKTLQRGDPEKRWRVIKTLEEMNAELDAKNIKANDDFFLKETLKQGRQ